MPKGKSRKRNPEMYRDAAKDGLSQLAAGPSQETSVTEHHPVANDGEAAKPEYSPLPSDHSYYQAEQEPYDPEAPKAEPRVGADSGSRGPAKQMYSGTMFYLLDPKVEDVRLNDIAHHLAHIIRWTGGVTVPFTVAQHCLGGLMVYREEFPDAGPTELLGWLLHDAHEAYTGDLSHPLKVALEARAPGIVKELITPIQAAIRAAFPRAVCNHERIKHVDMIMLATEAKHLVPESKDPWRSHLPKPRSMRVLPRLTHRDAKVRFLTVFENLYRKAAK